MLAAALAARPGGAQVRASLDAGVSHVEYQGFLPSAAFSLTPALRVGGERLGLLARGTWLTFESGNSSIQGVLAGSLRLGASPQVAAELGAELGASRYETFAQFSHGLGWARLRFPESDGLGGWIAATAGAAAFDSQQDGVQSLAAAFRSEGRDVSVTLAGIATLVGGAGYADLQATVRHARPSGFVAEAVIGLRADDPNDDPGPYVEATLTFPIVAHAQMVLAGGRYATDAVRGIVAGRYITAALRIAATGRRRSPIALAAPDSQPGSEGILEAALVSVRRGRGEACTLVFRAAATVEVMGDFTDWLPVTLQPAGRDRWSVTLPIDPGRHRLNVRVSGGAWGVPAGTTSATDDFQGVVGTVVIP